MYTYTPGGLAPMLFSGGTVRDVPRFNRRQLLVSFAGFLATTSLAVACSSSGTSTRSTPSAPTSGQQNPTAIVLATPTAGVIQFATPVATQTTSPSLGGEILVVAHSSDQQSYQALASAYMKLNPGVKVTVQLKAGTDDSWLQWLQTQFAAGTPKISIMNEVHIRDFVEAGKILNQEPYLAHANPYTKQKWGDGFVQWALDLVRNPSTGEMYTAPYESVKTFWVYNKSIFNDAGITEVPDQPTWSQLVDWCKKIKAKGHIPIGMAGTADRMWTGGDIPWLFRSGADQYCRDQESLIRAQKGDWDYRDGIDNQWTYDPADPHNDDPSKVSLNSIRHLKALRDKTIRFDDGQWWSDYIEHMGELFGPQGFIEPGWLGTQDAYPLFLTQKAAMFLETGNFFTQFAKDVRSLAQGQYKYQTAVKGQPTPTPAPDELEAKVFDYGVFNFATMEGTYARAKARCNEVTAGYLSIPKKDHQQNELEMNFLMFWTSPAGLSVFIKNQLDPNNLNGGVGGPPVINGVSLPAEWDKIFSQLKFIGNYEKSGNPGDAVARGFYLYPPSVRDWSTLVQSYFRGDITSKQYAERYQKLLETHWDGMLKFLNITNDDVDHPEKRPPGWKSTGPYNG
jgi:raffinose/stachyose/melibiose transport system substrate-binding protein